MATEKSPLLDHYNHGDVSGHTDVAGSSQNVYVPPIGPDELPPPYNTVNNGSLVIACKVCSCMIDISGKRNQHVVKCVNCNEATPVKIAPPGKKYVRCPCNCLLICKATSERVACPREECKRIINLGPTVPSVSTPSVPGMCQVFCAHCQNMFLFNTLNNSLARCPHCRKVSSIGLYFARRRAFVYLALFLIITIIFAIVIALTYDLFSTYRGILIVPIGMPILALIFLVQSIRFFTMKVSIIEGPV